MRHCGWDVLPSRWSAKTKGKREKRKYEKLLERLGAVHAVAAQQQTPTGLPLLVVFTNFKQLNSLSIHTCIVTHGSVWSMITA
jgi:hypothetical protein